MVQAGFVAREAAGLAAAEPLTIVPRALEAEAPYFVDMIGQQLAERFPALVQRSQRLDVYTTLDLHLQRLAQDAVREGLTHVDELLSKRKRRPGPAQAALIAVDPAHRRDPRVGRRALLQPVAVQPRRHGAAPARLGVQAVRLPGRVREGRGRGPHGPHARHARHGRADDVPVRGPDVGAAELRGRVRRPDHAPPRARALPQRRDGAAGRDGRLRHGGGPVEKYGPRHGAEAVPVDRARGLRGHAVRDRDGLHGVPQPRPDSAAARHPPDQHGLQGGGEARSASRQGSHPAGNGVPRGEHACAA